MPGPDLRGDFCFCFPLVLLGVNSIHLGLLGRFGEIYIYFFFHCCCYFISKRMTAHIGAGRAEQGRELRQNMSQHGSPSSSPSALSPLPDEGGHRARAGCEKAGPGWRGKMKAQPSAWTRGQLGEGVDQGAFVFIFCSSSPMPTRARTHSRSHRSSSDWVFFPALVWGASRALFMAVEDADI